jgi:hypothetical protein
MLLMVVLLMFTQFGRLLMTLLRMLLVLMFPLIMGRLVGGRTMGRLMSPGR